MLEADLTLPQDKVKEFSEVAVTHINAALSELRRLFLVEDLVDSIKFGVLLWCLTYLGAWFNGMTILIMGKNVNGDYLTQRLILPFFHYYSVRCIVHFAQGLRE